MFSLYATAASTTCNVIANITSSKGGEHRSKRNEITSSQLTDTGEFNKD